MAGSTAGFCIEKRPFSSLLIQNGRFVEALSFPSYKVLVLLAKIIK